MQQLLTSAKNNNIKKLLRIQNALARVVHHVPKKDHISLTLAHLHWLPAKIRIDYKLGLLSWKVT